MSKCMFTFQWNMRGNMHPIINKEIKEKEGKIGEIPRKKRRALKKSLLPGGTCTKKISICHFWKYFLLRLAPNPALSVSSIVFIKRQFLFICLSHYLGFPVKSQSWVRVSDRFSLSLRKEERENPRETTDIWGHLPINIAVDIECQRGNPAINICDNIWIRNQLLFLELTQTKNRGP